MSQCGVFLTGGGVAATQFNTDAGNVVPSALGVVTIAGGDQLTTSGAGSTITLDLDNGTDGQLLIGGGAAPVWATLTSTGGTVDITNGANSINLEISGGIEWVKVIASQTMEINHGYIPNDAGLITLTLPATAAVGDIIEIAGLGAGGWKIAQNAGQTIHYNSNDTTAGVAGYLSSTNRYNAIAIVCTVADTEFVVKSSCGNITIN